MDNFSIGQQRPNNSDTVTTGRIINIDRQNRNFTVMTEQNRFSVIQFNLADNARIFDIFGRQINFSCLTPGMRVRVRHAMFMTMNIPPQTTAFSVRVIR